MLDPYKMVINKICLSQDIKSSAIFYSVNQLIDLQFWNSSFCLISIFGINEYLKGYIKNIICLLYRIALFIRQHKLKDKIAKDIP